MKAIRKGEWIGNARRLFSFLKGLHVPLYAANAGFFLVLAIFPGLLLVLGTLQMTGFSADDLLSLMEAFLPQALDAAAARLVSSAYQGTFGMSVSAAAFAALWSASRGTLGLLTGLDAVYGVRESRSFFHTRALCLLYTFAFQLTAILTLALHVFGKALAERILELDPFLAGFIRLRFLQLLILQTGIFTLMYRVLPNRKSTFRECLPGGLLTSVGWTIFSDLYSRYVVIFPKYAKIYGSVYVVAVGMLWLYFCLSIFFYGGALNRLLAAARKKRRRKPCSDMSQPT